MEMLGKSKCTFNELHGMTKINECIPENEILWTMNVRSSKHDSRKMNFGEQR